MVGTSPAEATDKASMSPTRALVRDALGELLKGGERDALTELLKANKGRPQMSHSVEHEVMQVYALGVSHTIHRCFTDL